MIYPLIRPFATLAFKAYFKKIYFQNAENIPWDKPLIIAVNHPTSFLEPCILACFFPKPLNFLVRGDIWKKKFYIKLMRGVNLVPLYRQKDGYSNLTKNYETFEFCYQALAEHRNIVVLPEGSTSEEKRLRPIKKGMARICLSTLEQFPDLDILVIPVGANFTFPNRIRSEVMFKIGEPLRVKDFQKIYEENPNRAVLQLTQKVYDALSPLVLTIHEVPDEQLAESLFEIYRNEQPAGTLSIVKNDGTRLENEMKIADGVNKMGAFEKDILKKEVAEYFENLKNAGVTDLGIAQENRRQWYENILIFAGFLPAQIGKFLHLLPLKYARHVADSKVKQKEFYASVYIAVALIGSLIYYLVLSVAGGLIFGKTALLYIFAFFLLGWFSIIYYDFFRVWQQKIKAKKLPEKEKTSLMERRKKIAGTVENFLR
ncbi:MAG TPA: 1-acyl-sn-glycerol-3-phosphate acyltransferase [Saprospiraceae bacterium]|nr:1-acyl-sn-glycerol-3-phosphate acyltransferase [Saprospiraceae bacterium]